MANGLLHRIKREYEEEAKHSKGLMLEHTAELKKMLKGNKLVYLIIPFILIIFIYNFVTYKMTDISNAVITGVKNKNER